jgi:FtsP/CotA-like multicopper oxidase with cupredoxin domain
MSISTQDPHSDVSPVPEPPDGKPDWLVGIGLIALAAFGVIALIVAVVVVKQDGGGGSGGSAAAASGPATAVTLSEFTISPEMITATTGGGLNVTNAGKVGHDLAVEGTTLVTPTIDPGKTAHLDLSSLAPGTYTVYCQIPGHADAGMKAMLHLGGSSGTGAAAGSAGAASAAATNAMTADQMDAAMKASMSAFPAKTEGLGAQLLAPTVLADGTKQFDLTAEVVQWERAPGDRVAAWTYNGTVPGPTLQVDDGDQVAIVLHNHLPESTSIHFHGLQTPNNMDGTTDVTQDPVRPGETFTYRFVAHGPAVGMYHSHHDAVKQVPDGLAGAILVGHEPVPAGVAVTQNQVMILDDSGTIGYALNGKSFPATAPIVAKLGDWVEVQYMNEGTQIHPMHLHGMPQQVIAKDGYPLANPEMEDTVTVAPGERYTVLIHATEPGTWVWHCHILTHAENDQGMFGMVTALVVQ